jgi:F0F1-type ATP synthase assembly protein I
MDIFNFFWLFILFKFIFYDGEAIKIIISITSLLISLGATIAAFLDGKALCQ